MDALKGLAKRLRAIFGKRRADHDLEEEIRHHIELETEQNIRAGMPREEARRQAMVAFGGVERIKEDVRDGRGSRWAEDLLGDARHALRVLRRAPVLATTAIITLMLGIGANTAIFSAVSAVILRPLPYANAERLVRIGEDNAEQGWHQAEAAPANYFDWREQAAGFSAMTAYVRFRDGVTLTGEHPPLLLSSMSVGGNFFSVLGVAPEAGRAFTDDETWDNRTRVAMISHRLWKDEFASRPDVVGRTVKLDGRDVQIVGVVPASFFFPGSDADVWRPIGWDRADRSKIWFRRAHWLTVIGRLKEGYSVEQADATLQAVVARLKREYPATNAMMGAGMTGLHEALIGPTRRPLLVLLGAVALLLLIACANVGNLLLAHAAGRDREVALRLALGAARGRLIRQALTESLVLSAIGGAAGLVLGWWATGALLALRPEGLLPVKEFGMSWPVLGYIALLTTASGLMFGIAPALWSARRAPASALKEGGRGGSMSARARRWGNGLVVGEVALALLLTIGAGLFVHSLWRLRAVDPGFEAEGLLTMDLDLPGLRYDSAEKVTMFYRQLRERAGALPGVTGAALVSQLPLTGSSWTSDFSVQGESRMPFGVNVMHREVGVDYQTVMRIPLLRGRVFTAQDRRGAPPVVLINEALARKYFADRDPIGAQVGFDRIPDSTTVWRTIVGVVGSERQDGLAGEPHEEILAPLAQDVRSAETIVLRTSGDPAALAPALRRQVAALDPDLAIQRIRPMTEVAASSVAQQRFLATMMLVFAGVGLALAVVGVYGVMAQLALDRKREMGIRVALGARAAQVQWLVVRRGLGLVAVGVAGGLGAAFLATRTVQALLYGVGIWDPATFIAVPAILIVTAALATWIPALRVSRTDPAGALRGD